MSIKSTFPTKGFTALFAIEHFSLFNFFSMNISTVGSQIASLCKRFVTHCAAEWFFTCMNSHMHIKFTFMFKDFAALLAAEQLCLFDSRHFLLFI
jgi:hypothetical protein